MTGKNNYSVIGILSLLILILLLTSCTMNSAYRKKGLELINSGNYDEAVRYYSRLLSKNPGSAKLKTQLLRAKSYSFFHHLSNARNYVKKGNGEGAKRHYTIALELFPKNSGLRREYSAFLNRGKKRTGPKPVSEIISPVKLKIDGQKIDSLSLKNTSIRKIFSIVGKSYNINFIFDKDFRDFPYSIEVGDISFYEILRQLCLVTNSRYRIIDSSSVLIYPNTAFKKRNFDLRGIKVFFLSNITGEEAKKLIIPMFRDEQIMIQEDANLNSIIVKASENTLREIEKFIRKIDVAKSEVEFDVEILEVNRTVLNKIGADFGTTFSTLKIGKGADDGSINSTFNVNELKNSNFFLTLPTIALNILGSDDNSKIIAKPNLRGVNGEEIKFMVGDELPIPQTTFQSIAAGGIESSPVTSYQYKNVGVEIKLTPTIHRNGEVTVKIKMTINFVTTYTEQFPVLGKRELENTIRLKEGESSIIGGFIRDEMRGKLQGIPFISKIPVIGRLFGNSEDTVRQTDIIFSITPRFLRNIKIDDESKRPIWSVSDDKDTSTKPVRTRGRSQGIRNIGSTGNNVVRILPQNRSVRVNNSAVFVIGLSSDSPITTLSFSGNITGGNAEIEELSTDTIKDKDVKVLKNNSATGFDLGYSFGSKPAKSGNIGRLRIKFKSKGTYRINIENIFSSFKREKKNLKPVSAIVQVI